MRYEFTAEVWRYPGEGGWRFLTLPAELTDGLRAIRGRSRGWGSMRVIAAIGSTSWRTSIFPQSKSKCFVLPVKAEVRRREGIGDGDPVAVSIEIDL